MALLVLAAIPSTSEAAAPCVTPAPACASLPTPVYLQVGDTQNNVMKRLGRALRDNTAKPITLAWVTSGSCTNIDVMYHKSARITANMQYIPSTTDDPTWTPADPTCPCVPPSPDGVGTPGVFPDVGNSALFNSACTTEAPPATLALTTGPTQAYVMAVPKQSTQTAITYEEAYFVFGFGMAGMIAPWTDETQLFIRTTTKSTLLAWAANISVPGAQWKGMRFDTSSMVVSALEGTTGANIETALGILGAEVYDQKRATLTALAFRSKGQYAAYYPDATSTSRDKKNVRDGHYTVWSPTIWMDNVTGTTPTNADARYVIDLIAGKPVTPTPTFDANVIVANVGLVPDCAMRVTRAFEGGPLSLYAPTTSCTCKFEQTVDTTSCATCGPGNACATGVCRSGLCEGN
ncbi:MAG: hypothetical protein NT062_09480 [Proteobacteria bacterium]|nr:hypothetical protein [Pseudomonadota bacterium]